MGWISALRRLAVVLLVQGEEGGGWIHPPSAQGSSVGFCGSLASVQRLLPRARLPGGAVCPVEAAEELPLNCQPGARAPSGSFSS